MDDQLVQQRCREAPIQADRAGVWVAMDLRIRDGMRMNHRKASLLTFVAAFGLISATREVEAQTVRGRVLAEIGAEPVSGAVVSLLDQNGMRLRSVLTNRAGAFLIADVRPGVDQFTLKNGNRVYVIGAGRLVNLAMAEGHPASVMDMSFATQALATEFCVKNRGKIDARVHGVPVEVEEYVAREKLSSMGITIDELTTSQKKYMSGWEQGT